MSGWLHKAFGLVRGLIELAASPLARKRRELEQDLDAILNDQATYDLARAFQTRMQGARNQLLTFVAFPRTGRGSQQRLRARSTASGGLSAR